LTLFFNDDNQLKLGIGIIRHTLPRDGCQMLGIQLLQISPVLSGTSMLGASPQILELKSLLPQISSSGLNILIRGETGTGKNVLAQLIHDLCRGKQHPFIRVNCPSIPDSLFESELFGHEKGAYTDAKSSAPGYFRMAAEGTILLDEISEIQPHLQAKLLRVLEDKQFMPVGGQKLIPVRANIIATTNVDLEEAVEQGRFRQDLFFRLCEMPVYLPPLRERKQDVAMLAHYFLVFYSGQFRKPLRVLSNNEIKILQDHSWSGNIRELENYMKQTALLGKFVGPKTAAPCTAGENAELSEAMGMADRLLNDQEHSLPELTKRLTEQVERNLIAKMLDKCNQNRTHAAQQLGISYRTLLRKLDQHKLSDLAGAGDRFH
jgi:transcriptional regulator with PAS, ATPase and Fis domain